MALKITAKKDGHCRAGKRHIGTVAHPAGTFTKEQEQALKADPKLIVEEVPDEPQEGDGNPEDNARKGRK